MKLFSLIFAAASILLITGCDTLNHRQYLLVRDIPKNELLVLRSNLEKALSPVVLKHELIDAHSDARAPGVILYYKTKNNFPITIGTKETGSGLVVDIIHFHPGIGELENYSTVVKDVKNALKNINQYSVVELNYSSQIK